MIGVGVIQRLIFSGATKVTTSPTTASATTPIAIYTIYNNTGGPFTFNLPAVPLANQSITVIDAMQNAASHTITIQGNGNTIAAFTGISTSTVIASNGGAVTLIWDGTQWSQES
jgi:hypothetical protein